MDKDKPFRVRKAAYDTMLVTQGQGLKLERSRQKLEDLDFFRRLYSIVVQIARADYNRSFLKMMEVLSVDRYWHSYLREEGPENALHILANVGVLFPKWDGHNPLSLDEFLQKHVEGEWTAVPGRPVHGLSVHRLKPLAEITERFEELLFDENHRRTVLVIVEEVISRLERRRDDGYEGPGEDVRGVVNDFLDRLRLPPSPPSRHRAAYGEVD